MMTNATANFAQRGRFRALLLPVMQRMGLTQTCFAAKIGTSEATLRHWLNDNRSPALDWLLLNHRRLPRELVAAILQDLAGDRFTVTVMPEDVTEGCIQTMAVNATAATADLAKVMTAYAADGYSSDELNDLLRRVWAVVAEMKAITVLLTIALAKQTARALTRRTA